MVAHDTSLIGFYVYMFIAITHLVVSALQSNNKHVLILLKQAIT